MAPVAVRLGESIDEDEGCLCVSLSVEQIVKEFYSRCTGSYKMR